MASEQNPEESTRDANRERRQQPREDDDSMNWESIVLKRVARRVNSLSSDADSSLEPSRDRGWEEAALLAIRRRIGDFKPE